MLLAINFYEIIGNFHCLQMSPCQLVICSTNIEYIMIELDPFLHSILYLVRVKCTAGLFCHRGSQSNAQVFDLRKSA